MVCLPRIAIVLLLGGAACTPQTPSSSNDAPLCVSTEGGKPEPCLGCAVPEARWAEAGPLSCPRPIADYCNQNASPIPSTTAPDCPPSDWNALLASERKYGWPPIFYECDGFNLTMPSWSCGIGTNVLFVYDGVSGQLTSAVEFGAAQHSGQQTCLAGASSIEPLNLVSAHCRIFNCFPPDSGIDAGQCDLDAGAMAD